MNGPRVPVLLAVQWSVASRFAFYRGREHIWIVFRFKFEWDTFRFSLNLAYIGNTSPCLSVCFLSEKNPHIALRSKFIISTLAYHLKWCPYWCHMNCSSSLNTPRVRNVLRVTRIHGVFFSIYQFTRKWHCILDSAAAVAQSVIAFALQGEGWVFESQTQQT